MLSSSSFSGAEGTIIEEPESLPRVIWGLESDETSAATRSHSKSKSSHIGVSKPPPQLANDVARPGARVNQDRKPAVVPHAKLVVPPNVGRPPHPIHNAATPIPPPAQQLQLPQPPDFMLKHSEPIDLGRLVAEDAPPRRDMAHDYHHQGAGWQTPYTHSLPTPELIHDLSPELQAMLFAQERLRSHGLSHSALATNDYLTGSISASSSGSSLLDALKSSRSPIVLEDLATQYANPQIARASALDIAQKYRQQQLQQNLLPTPPNSTSPIWSSAFSPYQGGLLSPELLAAAGLSQINSHFLSSQNIPPRMDPAQQLLRQNIVNSVSDGRLPRLAPAAHISTFSGHKLPPRLAAEYARRRAVPDDHQLHQYTSTSPVRHAPHDPAVSPSAPRVPPNTPHGIPTSYGARRLDPIAHSMDPPSSPPSQQVTTSLGLPQQMRSIPLSRLVQRRLSTVPEEDYASSVDGRTPPPPSRGSVQPSPGGSSGLHLFLSPGSRANANAGSLGSLGDTLGSRYSTDGMGVSGQKARNMTPGVKHPATNSGPVPHSEPQSVKEASRRQGSNNVNNDGGRRGENGRGRGQKRGGRGRKPRGGAERVDGGIVVKS